jgi:glycosyltransferase involved in cell wall biosynthesis
VTTRRVVHYVDSDVFGGVERVALSLVTGLAREGWRPTLYLHSHEGMDRLVQPAAAAGVACRVVPRPSSAADVVGFARFARRLLADKPNVFHAHLGWPLACRLGLLAARAARVPLVVATAHLHVPLAGVRMAGAKQWLQRSSIDQYMAVSREVESRLNGELGVTRRKIRVVYNGIAPPPPESARHASLRAELLDGHTERSLILTAARLHPQKGHEFLLRAAAALPNCVFALAGQGPDWQRLSGMASQLGLSDRVRFLGHRDDVRDLMACCDLFVLPSFYEGLPLVALEAMAAGKAVIASAVGGTDEAVQDGVTGLLVPAGDADALASAILSLLEQPDRALRMGVAGRTLVERQFSDSAMVRAVLSGYGEGDAGLPSAMCWSGQ